MTDPIEVKSSNIRTVQYNPVTHQLTVVFKNNATHHYADVPKSEYDRLLAAKSIGSHFHANILKKFKGHK